jgi:hypothetical protein
VYSWPQGGDDVDELPPRAPAQFEGLMHTHLDGELGKISTPGSMERLRWQGSVLEALKAAAAYLQCRYGNSPFSLRQPRYQLYAFLYHVVLH